MNVVRTTSGVEQYRILENFWESQISSKQWIVKTLRTQNVMPHNTVYIFGGWFGVLGGILLDNFPEISKVYSIDIDPDAKRLGEKLNPDVVFLTDDMANFEFHSLPSLIINTSTEHVSQDIFDNWLSRVPKKVCIVLQGNNFFSCSEHVRCSNNIDEFKKMNPLDVTKYHGELDCKDFTRYMTIGYNI